MAETPAYLDPCNPQSLPPPNQPVITIVPLSYVYIHPAQHIHIHFILTVYYHFCTCMCDGPHGLGILSIKS